jgi:anthranilate synthase/aminodeoxychorismate synthase-like glutamine amidotransferase
MSATVSVLLVDCFDSFSFNLVDEFARRGCPVEVVRSDLPATRVLERAAALPRPRLLVLSPGPGAPEEAGCAPALAREAGAIPTFGVCLGLQVMVSALGGEVGPAGQIVHGKASRIHHDGSGLFTGLPCPLTVGRYHSLAALRLPPELERSAWLEGRIMAARHIARPLAGVQFHPESVLTPQGGRLVENVLGWAAERDPSPRDLVPPPDHDHVSRAPPRTVDGRAVNTGEERL